MMNWLLLALFVAFLEGSRLALKKFVLQKTDAFIVMTATKIMLLPFFVAALFFLPWTTPDQTFWVVVSIVAVFGVAANLLQLHALKISPISLVIPFITFTPIFLLLFTPFLLGEVPKPIGLMGVLFVVVGAYVLNVTSARIGIFEPFKALTKELGPILMIGAALLFAVTNTLDKIALQHSTLIFYFCVSQSMMGVFSIPFMVWKSPQYYKKIKTHWLMLLFISLLSMMIILLQFQAIKMALVVYVISIKRLAVVVGVIYGAVLFKEKNTKERLLGVMIMVIGAVLVAVA